MCLVSLKDEKNVQFHKKNVIKVRREALSCKHSVPSSTVLRVGIEDCNLRSFMGPPSDGTRDGLGFGNDPRCVAP